MTTYSVWYFSNESLGNIKALECSGVDLETAKQWFIHHTTNVTAKVGFTQRVIITDSDDFIVAEWKHGQGITWPKEDKPGMTWYLTHPNAPAMLGYIPKFLSLADSRPAKEQFNERYVFGGWKPFGTGQWTMNDKFELLYPGDPPTIPVAWTLLRDERIVVYDHAWVAIIQPDGSFEVSRMD